jgi:cytidine deaminase
MASADETLLDQAREASLRAYAPHSRFRVGAAVRSISGATYLGCNVENASYGLTICAERAAIFAAVQAEGPQFRLASVACWVQGGGDFPPCGACRQVIAEFADDQAAVLWSGAAGPVKAELGDLLPGAFRLDRPSD